MSITVKNVLNNPLLLKNDKEYFLLTSVSYGIDFNLHLIGKANGKKMNYLLNFLDKKLDGLVFPFPNTLNKSDAKMEALAFWEIFEIDTSNKDFYAYLNESAIDFFELIFDTAEETDNLSEKELNELYSYH